MRVGFLYWKLPVRADSRASVPRQYAQIIRAVQLARPDWHPVLFSRTGSLIEGVETHAVLGDPPSYLAQRLRNVLRTPQAPARLAGGIRRACRDNQPDVWFTVKPEDILLLSRLQPGTPVVFSPRSLPQREHAAALSVRLSKARHTVVQTWSFYDAIFESLLYDGLATPVSQVFNSVDRDVFYRTSTDVKSEIRRALGIDTNAIVMVHVGTTNPKKGWSVIRAALVEAARDQWQQPIEVLTIGAAQAVTEALNPRMRIRYVPPMDPSTLATHYRCADIGLVPSVCHDASPNVAIEMLASGLPVMASAVGGIPELLEGQPHRLIRRPNDPKEWATAIASFVNTEATSAPDQELVERRHGLRAVGAAWACVFEAAADADYRVLDPGGVRESGTRGAHGKRRSR